MLGRSLLPTLLASLLASPVAAATATVSQILAAPSTYSGSHVEVSGRIENLERKVSHLGNAYVTFSLCSRECVHVFAFGSPTIKDGQAISVRGTFTAVKRVGPYTFYNEIDADDGSL